MSSASLPHDALLPRPPGGQGLGAVLSLAAHGLLLFALVTVVQWRTHTREIVSAELWSSVPEMAAPAPPEPTAAPQPAPQPAPPPATVPAEPPPRVDIATERAERARQERVRQERLAAEADAARRKKEQARAEAERKRLALEQAERERRRQQEQAQAAAAEARLEQQRQDNLKRMMGQAGVSAPGATASAAGPAGTGARNAAPTSSYAGRLVAVIRSNLVFTGDVPGNPVAEVRVRATATGTVLSREVVKRSGHAAWDDAVLRAIDKTGTLPRDTDGRVPPEIIISFRPKE